ncbi:MAG: hypothetical protein M0C28_41270 [Candidatus Moduliflexus flocculans]|nr:hypothetical protein [Candidatus Moduliflexus flocculans]
MRTGFGQPSIFNADADRAGAGAPWASRWRTPAAAAPSGCVETGAFGKEAYILTGYFNLPKVLEIDPEQRRRPAHRQAARPADRRPAQLRAASTSCSPPSSSSCATSSTSRCAATTSSSGCTPRYMPAPFLSLLIDDCIASGKDYHDGGARYNTTYIQGVGIGTITDACRRIKHHVFDDKTLTHGRAARGAATPTSPGTSAQRQLLLNQHAALRQRRRARRRPDACASSRPTSTPWTAGPTRSGGDYRINLLPTTCHVYFGSVTGATPDGRQAWTPLSEGISPVQGADRHGPTAVLKSAAKMDHVRTGGTLLNQKFTPQLLADDDGLDSLVQLVRAYFKLDGHHIQFNVVDADTLRDAQAAPRAVPRPDRPGGAGYSDYFQRPRRGPAERDHTEGRSTPEYNFF